MEAVELRDITRNLSSVMGNTVGQFKQAATESTKNLNNIVRDLFKAVSSQSQHISDLAESTEDVASNSRQTATKIDSTNILLQESINVQNNVLSAIKNMGSDIRNMNEQVKNLNSSGGLFGTILDKTGIGNFLKGALGMASTAITGATVVGGMGAMLSGAGEGQSSKQFTGTEKAAKEAADRYLGRPLSDNEWSELVKATHAEAGQKSQSESAMVMASILNRARNKQKSVSEILREPSQFQAVTGTKYNPNPSEAFVQGPGEKRAADIYGAAANILERVSKEQTKFTAASSAAYGPGTSTRYRDELLAAGGTVVGGSGFNTAAPSMPEAATPAGQRQDTTTPGSSTPNFATPRAESATTPAEKVSGSPTMGAEAAKQFLQSRQGGGAGFVGVNADKLDPSFAVKMAEAIQKAEAATGTKAVITEGYRPPEIQAQYYANYIQQPVPWDGKTYYPQRQGGIAAPPGRSRHQRGLAVDLSQNAARDWLEQHASELGLGRVSGDAPHFQSGGGDENAGPITRTQPMSSGPGMIGAPIMPVTRMMSMGGSGPIPNLGNMGALGADVQAGMSGVHSLQNMGGAGGAPLGGMAPLAMAMAPVLMNALGSLTANMQQPEQVATQQPAEMLPPPPAETPDMLNKVEVERQAEQQAINKTIADSAQHNAAQQQAVYVNQSSTGQQQYPLDYNNDLDRGWADWASMLGHIGFPEMDKIKLWG